MVNNWERRKQKWNVKNDKIISKIRLQKKNKKEVKKIEIK